jgi:hypothetical protein
MTTKREDELLAQGWIKQFIAGEPRLTESVELYSSLGYEVLLEPISVDKECGECRICFVENPEQYKIIYTRKTNDQESL